MPRHSNRRLGRRFRENAHKSSLVRVEILRRCLFQHPASAPVAATHSTKRGPTRKSTHDTLARTQRQSQFLSGRVFAAECGHPIAGELSV